jgi:hypothetical protein
VEWGILDIQQNFTPEQWSTPAKSKSEFIIT